jgi:two-component system nitrogen regulation sensor histidine kinase NtrY
MHVMLFSRKISFHKRFRFQILLRIISLVLLIFLLSYLIFYTQLYATIFIVALLIIYLTYSIFRYVEKTNQELSRFFEAIKYSDFSQSFSKKGWGAAFDDLHNAFSEVIQKFQETRSEKEEHYRYLQNVVQHVGIGLIAYDPDGEVELINNAAKRLLGVNQLRNIQVLSGRNPGLVQTLFQLKAGDKALVKFQDKDELLHLIIYTTAFKLWGNFVTLISIQNIQSELEEKEMEAWQKLIRVMTHEIMNSITPIASLASTINGMLRGEKKETLQVIPDMDTVDDVRSAVKTIQRRSEGLLKFVESYRSLARLPKPDFQIFAIRDLFERVRQLLQPKFDEKNIEFKTTIYPPPLELTADPELIEQALINLLLNAIHAVANGNPGRIELNAHLNERSRIRIQVTDNGPGIPEEIQEKIFIPFFSTDKDGSGIGLSLSRQIMRLHSGTIAVHSKPNIETIFSLRF